MARRAEGFRVRLARGNKNYSVRFRLPDGRRFESSTGTSDRTGAHREAARIYAATIHQGKLPETARTGLVAFELTERIAAEWLAQLPLRPKTVATYKWLALRWMDAIKDWSADGLQAYAESRLRVALRSTVQTEVSALRGFLKWSVRERYMTALPSPLPIVEKGKQGTKSKQRVRCAAPDYSAKEIRAFLAKLPERSKGRPWTKPEDLWLVRPRCELIYELALRPATADRLRVPEHYERGATHLRISADIDKEGVAREIKLTKRARRLLEKYAPESGLIFGEHKYSRYIGPAAVGTISPAKVRIFTGQHLRSARATHLLGGKETNLKAVAFIMGHEGNVATTARYVRTTQRDADALLGAM